MGTATKARVKLLIARALSSFLTPAAFVISVALIAAVIASEIVWGFGRNWMFYHVNHVLFVDQNIGKVDGIDAGTSPVRVQKGILAGAESGIIHWYEQTGPGVFEQRTIWGSTVSDAKQEGAAWIDIDGDGDYEVVRADQHRGEISVFKQDTCGSRGTW